MKFKISVILLLSLVPSLASAHTRTGGARMSPQLHDRTPKAHVHSAKPHLTR